MIFGRMNLGMVWAIVIFLAVVSVSPADTVIAGQETINERQVSWLGNDQVKCSVVFQNG